MARRRAKAASEQRGSLTPCPSLLLLLFFFLSKKPASLLFECFYSLQDGNVIVPLAGFIALLNARMLETIWPSEMWVYRKSLGRPIPRHSFYLVCPLSLPVAHAIPCPCCQNILFQFSALRRPNSFHRQLDGVDVARASLPAHYPTPCHAPSLPGPSRHKLIGLNPVINRLERQLSMFASLPKAGPFLADGAPSLSRPSPFQSFSSARTQQHYAQSCFFLFGSSCQGEAHITGH